MLTNADITIYNRKFDKKTGFDLWNRTVIRDVHVYVDHKVSVGDTGLNSADVYKIRIPIMLGMRIFIFRQKSTRRLRTRPVIGRYRTLIISYSVCAILRLIVRQNSKR